MSKKIKVGIAGIGRAGWGMHCGELKNYADLFEITAACDELPDRVEKMKEKYDCAGYTDYDSFLADPEVELASIAVRSPEHTDFAIKALEAGKYVFVEKPIALKYADAQRLLEADKKYPGKLYCRHNRRFEPAFQHIREIIASGVIGNVYEIKLCRHGYQRRADWQTIISSGGGQLNNWGPHLIDHALRFIQSPVKEVWSNLKKIAAVGDAEDHLKIIITGESGIVVDVEISGGIALPSPVYAIYGTKGSLICEDEQDIKLKYIDPEQKLPELTACPNSPSLTESFGNSEPIKWRRKTIMVEPATGCDTFHIWKHLYEAIRNNVPFPVTLAEAAEVVRVTEMVKSGTEFEA